MPLQAVIFDMDGVVIDSEEVHKQTEIATLKHFGGDPSKVDWMSVKGIPLSGIFGTIIAQQQLRATWEEMAAYKKSLVYAIPPGEYQVFPGFYSFAEYIHERYKTALTTSAHRDITDLFFTQFGLTPFFDVVVTASDISNGKPHPEPFLITAKKLGVRPEDCVVIEDTINGVTAAQAAGCSVIAITNTFPRERLQNADYVVDSFVEAHQLFTTGMIA